MKILLVAGARPNFMKVAPILRVAGARGHECVLVHTGQHYDHSMSQSFFDDLEIKTPDHFLAVGSDSQARQTAHIMEAFEPVLEAEAADWMIVVGDVNSTLACSLVAAKLKEAVGTRIAHVEAGLRSFDWRMPEEVNRVLTDRLADLLLTPSADAAPNLAREGIEGRRVVFVGNVMIDTLDAMMEKANRSEVSRALGVNGSGYVVATVHRPSNVDHATNLRVILRGLSRIASQMPVVFPVHPRTRKSIDSFGLTDELSRLKSMGAVAYTDMLALMSGASCVLTDSGGMQEETTALGVPCVTLREQTERPITISEGTNRLADWPLDEAGIARAFEGALADRVSEYVRPRGWDGKAAERICDSLECFSPS